MKKTLYIDTHSNRVFHLGVHDLETFKTTQDTDAAKNMIKKIEEISNNDYEQIIINKGPGSLTGLRIGSSFAQGISLAKKIPVLGLSIWDLLLNEFPDADIFFYTGTKKWIKKNKKEELIVENNFYSDKANWISNKPELLPNLDQSKMVTFPNCIELMHKYRNHATFTIDILYPIDFFNF